MTVKKKKEPKVIVLGGDILDSYRPSSRELAAYKKGFAEGSKVCNTAMCDACKEAPSKQLTRVAKVLENLISLYVMNTGSDGTFPIPSEFIACITCKDSAVMTKKERAKDKTWKAWDSARAILKEIKEDI